MHNGNHAVRWKMAVCFPELSENDLNVYENKIGDQMNYQTQLSQNIEI